MNIQDMIREQLLKAAAVSTKPYKKADKPYDYTAPMKGERKRHNTSGTKGTDKPMDAQHRVKYAAHEAGFIDGFVDLLQYAGLTKEAAYDALQEMEKVAEGGGMMNMMSSHPLATLAGGAGLGALGTLGAQKLMGMMGRGGAPEGDETIQPPEDAQEQMPDMSMYGQQMMDPYAQYGEQMMYDPYMEQQMGGYGQNMMVPGAWYGY